MPATYEERDSGTGVCPWILRNFYKHLSSWNTYGGCFWNLFNLTWKWTKTLMTFTLVLYQRSNILIARSSIKNNNNKKLFYSQSIFVLRTTSMRPLKMKVFLLKEFILTHLFPTYLISAPWKHQVFSGGRDIVHWEKMG